MTIQNYKSIIVPCLGANHIAGHARHVYIKQLYSSLRGIDKKRKRKILKECSWNERETDIQEGKE